MPFSESDAERIKELSKKVMKVARDSVIINMRFMDIALSRITPVQEDSAIVARCDGRSLLYSPRSLLESVRKERSYAVRLFLHVLFHYIFSHPYSYNRIEGEKNKRYFSLAADIATEAVVLDLGISGAGLSNDSRRYEKLRVLAKNSVKLTAQSIYRYFITNELSYDGEKELSELFSFDDHSIWDVEDVTISLAEWQKLSERIKADIKSFSKHQNKSEGLSENLEEATREKYDYTDILSRFCVLGEDVTVNDEEFDYIYYTYGLSLYDNMPLVEPLEYKDVKKVREFAIVLDTSASCQGHIIQTFLRKTYSILKTQESFFSKVRIHIIECDNSVQEDIRITTDAEFEEFLINGKLTGFGGTDYRPAFEHVQRLIDEGEFEDLKGLIYFTDGYGIYPEKMPPYEAMFVFLDEDDRRGAMPPWAIKVVLSQEDL